MKERNFALVIYLLRKTVKRSLSAGRLARVRKEGAPGSGSVPCRICRLRIDFSPNKTGLVAFAAGAVRTLRQKRAIAAPKRRGRDCDRQPCARQQH